MKPEQDLFTALKNTHLTLSLAESCTGGLVSARLVSLPGISDFFLGGIVSYTNSVKKSLLSVQEETLEKYTAVSAEVAREMADGVRLATGSDIGVSVTGLAGPGGGTEEIPVGRVYIGVSTPDGCRALAFLFRGGRQVIRCRAADAALNLACAAAYQFAVSRKDREKT